MIFLLEIFLALEGWMIRQIIVYIGIIALLIFILVISGAALYFTLSGTGAPRPTLSVITYTPIEKNTQIGTPAATKLFAPTPTTRIQLNPPTATITPLSLPSATPHCGLTAPVKLLYINLGKQGENLSSQAVRMVNINPNANSMDIISYPCDLWITTPSLVNDYTISAIRLCSLIQLIKNSPGKNPGDADIARAIQMGLNDTFQIKSDQYLITTTDSLSKLVDQLKGIDYNSPDAITISGISLQKGINQVDSAAIFPLFSPGTQDATPWDTIDRQNNILAGIQKKFVASSMSLQDLLKSSNSETSFSNQDTSSLQCTLKDIPVEKIRFSDVLKGNTTAAQDGTINISNLPNILAEMKNIFGTPPQETSTKTPAAKSAESVTPGLLPRPDTTTTPIFQSTPTPLMAPTQTP
jgi:anionic cell wall polymer biosynthesis LytR-Cps2A-Psr (LCP) family protein